jgi:NAD(P)-dependent dehydrogenase (short-subunit alcohol dehydrogenase family)
MDPTLLESLSGQVALVTGANRGIGAEVAAGLADLGATVYAGTRDVEAVDPSGGLVPVHLDVTDDAGVEAAVDRIDDEAGRLDVLVNNAGIASGHRGTLLDEPVEEIDEVLAVNLRGPIVLTKRTLPLLLDRDGSRVVNASSGMGALGEGMSGGVPSYRISKAGLNAFSVYLHGEFGSSDGPGLIANSVCPGWVRTRLGGSGARRSVEEGADTPIWLSRFAPGAPGGHFWRDRAVIDW